MKKILKRVFTPIIISIVLGGICGRIIYKIYKEDIENKFSSQKIYLLQSGAYNSYESMKENNTNNNYLYYIEDNMYKSVIGITKDYQNANKIKNIYPKDLVIKEYYLSTNKVSEKQDEYDKMLSHEQDENKEWDIINNIINLYKNDEKMKLIEIK